MIITCASCLSKFNLEDSRISPKGAKVRCSRCHHVFYAVPPPETREEVLEGFESFAKYHEELMAPGESRPGGPPAEKAPQEKQDPPPEEKEHAPVTPPRESGPAKTERKESLFVEERAADRGKPEEKPLPKWEEEEEPKTPLPKEPFSGRRRKGPSPFLIILAILLLLVFGLFYLWSEMGSGGKLFPYFEKPVQKAGEMWGKIWGIEKEGLTVGDLSGYEEKVGDQSLLVIEGRVNNQYRYPKKYIKVKVIILDQDKIKMAEREAICGSLLSRQDLKNQPPSFFKSAMLVKPATEKEMEVPAGKTASFMVILRDPLNQAKEFKVEIMEAPNL